MKQRLLKIRDWAIDLLIRLLKSLPIWISIGLAQLLRCTMPTNYKSEQTLFNQLGKFIELKKEHGK